MLHVVLFQPEMPANTGNIGRLCLGLGAALHIIKPARFLLTDDRLRRAGLDYWENVQLYKHNSLQDFSLQFPNSRLWYCTTKTNNLYTAPSYQDGDAFVFGPESRGLDENLLNANPNNCITIPMKQHIRSHNLANSVAIITFEAWRQLDFT